MKPVRSLHNWRALACLLAVVLGVGILTLPAVEYNGDPFAWREEARAIVLHGSLSVDPEVATHYGERGEYFVQNDANGKWYSRYGSFNGLLNALPLAAERIVTGELPPMQYSPKRVLFLGIFFALLSAGIACTLYLTTGYYTDSQAARFTFVVLAFYTTYLWNYLRSTSSESTQLLLFALCYLFFLRFERLGEPLAMRPRKNIYLAWLMLLLLCQTKVSYVTLLPLLAFMLIRLALKSGTAKDDRRPFILRAVALPVTGICTLQGIIQAIKFGNPFFSGYHQFHDPYLPHTLWGATADFLWGGQGSIFVHFPLLLMAAFGARRFVRSYPLDTLLLAGSFLITYALVAPAGGGWRGEWSYGPRYFVVFLPLLSLPALYPLEWMLKKPLMPRRMAALGACAAASVFMVMVQWQITRMDYFFKYKVEIRPQIVGNEIRANENAPRAMQEYFTHTNLAKINWDHLQCNGHWERLPYYPELLKHITPEMLEIWKRLMAHNVFTSNLYWFPDINKPSGDE